MTITYVQPDIRLHEVFKSLSMSEKFFKVNLRRLLAFNQLIKEICYTKQLSGYCCELFLV